jgi:hypothetical protein
MSNSINLERFVQLLEMACHEGTPAFEAHSAARQAKKMLDAAGLSFAQIRFRRDLASLMNLPPMVPSIDLTRRVTELEELDRSNQLRMKALSREIERLKAENAHVLETRLKAGTSKWKPFWAVVTGRLQKTHGAYQRFCDRYNETTGANINEAVLRRWASKDEVPPEAVEFAKSSKILRVSEAEEIKSDQSWTMEELTQAEELFEKTKMTTNQIASQLGKRFGRRMDKHTVMNAKQRIFLRKRTLEMYDGGETNMRKILKTLKDEFPDGYGVTLMEVNRFVGLMRGRPDLLPAGELVLQESQS